MANQSVIDELVVKLTLDDSEYKQSDKNIGKQVDETERKQKDVDTKRKKRDTEQVKRNKDTLKSVKDLAGGLSKLAFTVATLLGVGSVGGVVGLLTGFASMETGLRRAAVSTGMSNKEMQAWGSTARRMGADAASGASAIADLAREQQQFNLTGNAPMIQAFARMGVNAGPGADITSVLEQAQKVYRAAAPAQQQQMESGLAASGASPDLILMIKSETDARAAYNRSLSESTEENKKALNALYDAISAVENGLVAFANTIATGVQPYVEQLGEWAHSAGTQLGEFVNKVVAAGGGVDGFMKVLDTESPGLSANLKSIGTALKAMGETVLVITYGLGQLKDAFGALTDWAYGLLGGTAKKNVSAAGNWVKDAWNNAVNAALHGGPEAPVKLSPDAQKRIAAGALNATPAVPAAPATSGGALTRGSLMSHLSANYGLTPAQAAAVTANAFAESGGNPGAFNGAGGGTGARGLFQWRGARTNAFRERFGSMPNEASWQDQVQFLMTDPYERRLLNRSLSGGGSAQALGERFSQIFEGHGNVAEDMRRGVAAAQLSSSYGGPQGAGIGTQINVQTMTVQANSPQEFSNGITRQTGVQNQNSAVR